MSLVHALLAAAVPALSEKQLARLEEQQVIDETEEKMCRGAPTELSIGAINDVVFISGSARSVALPGLTTKNLKSAVFNQEGEELEVP